MIILAIETSCDETAIAVVETKEKSKNLRFSAKGGSAYGGKILSNIIASQIKIHAKWGGVVPNLAKREHIKNLPIVLNKALKESKLKNPEKETDFIAVTIGPGLEPALWTGINFAQDLAKKWKKPLIAVNHMEGHIVASLLNSPPKADPPMAEKIKFPAIALLVSGGHTELVLMSAKGGPAYGWNYKIIGQTRDDAAGEAFDKVAKMLNLPYPGGPIVAKMATKIKPQKSNLKINLPRPMINSKNYDFSFSGLKTAVLYLLRDLKNSSLRVTRSTLRAVICAEFQQAVIDVLISKTIRAAKEYKVKTIILGGGVAANEELRKQLQSSVSQMLKAELLTPEIKFTGDNAAMVAVAAYFRILKKQFTNPEKLKADGNLTLK